MSPRPVAAALAAAICALAAALAHAAAEPAGRPRVFALVSAVGDQFSYVRQRQQVGSHLEPYIRHTVTVPDDALNAAVLRGLDRVVAQAEPGSERVFVKLNPAEMKGIAGAERERVAIGKVARALEGLPARQGWDRIVVVTPAFVRGNRQSMGTKLQGIGVYVQPLERGRTLSLPGFDAGLDTHVEDDAQTPAGEANRSDVFIAPFFYTRVWVLDAKTLEVLETEGRFDYRKIWDPMWTATDVQANLTPEQLAGEIGKFVETASARALRETMGVVTVTDPKPVPRP